MDWLEGGTAGVVKVFQLFGDKLDCILKEINEVLAA